MHYFEMTKSKIFWGGANKTLVTLKTTSVCLEWQSRRTWVCCVTCLTCLQHSFYWLCQLRRVWRSLDSESAATLVHTFVTSRVDQCNAVLSGATKSVTDTLQCVMKAAAHVVSKARKFDHGLTQIIHDDLHWVNVADRVTYELGVIMHRCRHGKPPQYLVNCCTPVTNVVGRQRLRSATKQWW